MPRSLCPATPRRLTRLTAFTLIELLVVVAIIALLISILVPSLAAARQQARGTICLSQLRVLGQGLNIYLNDNRDVLPPGRLPKLSGQSCDPYAVVYGRHKFRPTFLTMMSGAVGVPPFDDPQACKGVQDMHGEPGDQQNYSYRGYVCPSVPNWTDERNGSYGYNYQFLGNSRLLDDAVETSYKRWPVKITSVKFPGRTVCVADGMGTAASFPPLDRQPYDDDSKTEPARFGNEGFNLDPPRVDPVTGEMADLPDYRSAADPRHLGRAGTLWLDGHATAETLKSLGYELQSDGAVDLVGNNSQWSGDGRDVAWTTDFTY